MKKIIIPIICIMLLVSLFFLGDFNKEKENKLPKIKVAEVTHSIFYTPLYVAQALGYFEEEGLDVEIILTSGANNVAAAVMSGDVQIGFCGSEQTLYIYNEGAKDYLVNFAGMTKRDGSFLVSREPIDKFGLSKLSGVILGGRQGGMPAMTLNYTLHKNNINSLVVDTSIDFAGLSGTFIGGNGDYVTLFEPTALALEKGGYGYVVASIGELGGEVPYTTFNALKSYLNDNPETIERFIKAIQKGLNYTLNNDSKIIGEILINYFPDTSLNDIIIVVDRYKDSDSWYKTTYITESGYNHMQEIVDFNGFLTKKVDYSVLVNNTYNNE
jgi:ABC-type nitrate/sulfonate/bicarbonate transport systems, periplasmic components